MGLSWYEPRRGMGSGGGFLGCAQDGGCSGGPSRTDHRRTGVLASPVSVSARLEFKTWLCHSMLGELGQLTLLLRASASSSIKWA